MKLNGPVLELKANLAFFEATKLPSRALMIYGSGLQSWSFHLSIHGGDAQAREKQSSKLKLYFAFAFLEELLKLLQFNFFLKKKKALIYSVENFPSLAPV